MAPTGKAPATDGNQASNSNFEQAMERAIASLEYIMTKQIEFTERSNPPKAGTSMAQGSRQS
jgi:hypothetical protein